MLTGATTFETKSTCISYPFSLPSRELKVHAKDQFVDCSHSTQVHGSMSFNQNALRSLIDGVEKEDRPLKRQVDRQAKKINELTTRISELETKTEEQTELIALLRDERDDALDEMNQTLELLEPWAEYANSLNESKRTKMKQLSEALTKSQANAKQLEEENLALRREMAKERKVTSHAFNAPRHASHSDNAAFESLKEGFKDRGRSSPSSISHPSTVSTSVTSEAIGSNDQTPWSSHSKANRLGRHYTIEKMKLWKPAAVTPAVWKTLAPRNEPQPMTNAIRKPVPRPDWISQLVASYSTTRP
ncbi:MAG: hypothetical protein LQ341_001377 [Variospora aurantia]|nr:MAG: hypothetical protein LQ341_001377 [Variospora aurantia]